MFTSKKYLIVIVMVVLAIAAVASLHMQQAKSDSDQAAVSSTPTPTPSPTPTSTDLTTSATATPTPTPPTASTYKNGTYTATGAYLSPGGTEKVSLTVTLDNDTVKAASFNTTPASSTSSQYQSMFKSAYSSLVIGKPINSISLSRVSGSSLTSNGFNQALAKIKTEAHS